MKFLSYLVLVMLLFFSCNKQSETKVIEDPVPGTSKSVFPDKLHGSTIYEVNIRQFTPEGTFKAFSDHLPRLKDLGVDVLWLMPIHPISETNRKGTLGSYYAPKDYTAVNPEFGTIEDFKSLLDKAHEMGFYLILDWVPNHTGRDHHWVKEHPEYYIRDKKGNITYEAMSPTDVWWDTALLDNSKPETRQAMIEAMRFWVELGIDGFRLDHGCGDKIPLYLWEEARAALDPLRDLFWLAECGHETFILDGSYADEFETLMREVAAGEEQADALSDWIDKDMFKYGRTALRMTYTSNHDLNSWNGTVFERLGDGHQAFAAFVFTSYGFPLILGGQEVGMDKRLEFFEKDSISWTDPKNLQPFYKALVRLKKENPAIWSGDAGGFPISIEDNPNVVGFKREVSGNKVIGIFNLSTEIQFFKVTNSDVYGVYSDYFSNKTYQINDEIVELNPWEFLVFVE
ncbi:alpha-amylase family glycosyl hydrolase [Aestuariivivens sediminicola]|uniref:alpha-amylase family glycosyl hydrolase n=1 Tax=Aestuariivivens sediminicola TaxID=2913560 RepID=UPI001F5ADFE6|nr:alpha-amylase family glycosyl hydrolase [Aestuariivivens sediminicola]